MTVKKKLISLFLMSFITACYPSHGMKKVLNLYLSKIKPKPQKTPKLQKIDRIIGKIILEELKKFYQKHYKVSKNKGQLFTCENARQFSQYVRNIPYACIEGSYQKDYNDIDITEEASANCVIDTFTKCKTIKDQKNTLEEYLFLKNFTLKKGMLVTKEIKICMSTIFLARIEAIKELEKKYKTTPSLDLLEQIALNKIVIWIDLATNLSYRLVKKNEYPGMWKKINDFVDTVTHSHICNCALCSNINAYRFPYKNVEKTFIDTLLKKVTDELKKSSEYGSLLKRLQLYPSLESERQEKLFVDTSVVCKYF